MGGRRRGKGREEGRRTIGRETERVRRCYILEKNYNEEKRDDTEEEG